MVTENVFEHREALVQAVVDCIAAALKEAVNARGEATLLVSGGSSPQPVYDLLSEVDLPWASVRVALVDERWVAPAHSASNEAFIHRHLLKGYAAKAGFIGMKTSATTPQDGLGECESRYAVLPENADVCLLGMGYDGHTASLFPYAEGLAQALVAKQRCAAINAEPSDVTGDYTERMTLTAPYILAARQRILLLAGAEKKACFHDALAGDDVLAMPVRAILHANETTDVYLSP